MCLCKWVYQYKGYGLSMGTMICGYDNNMDHRTAKCWFAMKKDQALVLAKYAIFHTNS